MCKSRVKGHKHNTLDKAEYHATVCCLNRYHNLPLYVCKTDATLRIKEVKGELEIALFITNAFSVYNDKIQ